MPPIDPLDRPKRTKAERQAAKAARIAERPLRDHPKKGVKKPTKAKGGVKNPKAIRPTEDELTEARLDETDGFYRISRLDPTETASEFIIVPTATPAL